LAINYTTLKIATSLEVDWGKIEYQHTDSGIPDAQIMWLLLSIFLMTEKVLCTVYTISGYFGHKLHYIEALQPP
jgi:hypothetical protein